MIPGAHILPHFLHILNGAKVTSLHSIQSESSLVTHQNFSGKGRFVSVFRAFSLFFKAHFQINRSYKKPGYHDANGMELVTYNIVQAPRNFTKIFENKFKNYKRTKGKLSDPLSILSLTSDSTYHRKGAFDPMTTKVDLDDYKSTDVCTCCPRFDYKGLNVEYDSDSDSEDLSVDSDKPSEFYNLTDHIINSKRSHKKPKSWVWV